MNEIDWNAVKEHAEAFHKKDIVERLQWECHFVNGQQGPTCTRINCEAAREILRLRDLLKRAGGDK